MSTDKAADGGPSSTEMGRKDVGKPELNSKDTENSVVPAVDDKWKNRPWEQPLYFDIWSF
jgi:hypothetical protein